VKRFWTKVAITPAEGGYGISLDGRPLRTPAREQLAVPTEALATAIAEEWRASGDEFDPRDMPLTGLANAAIDSVAADPAAFAASLSRYAEGDLACYRAANPTVLVERQAKVSATRRVRQARTASSR
jgi:chaperone required for assembly of F1-ATPase